MASCLFIARSKSRRGFVLKLKVTHIYERAFQGLLHHTTAAAEPDFPEAQSCPPPPAPAAGMPVSLTPNKAFIAPLGPNNNAF